MSLRKVLVNLQRDVIKLMLNAEAVGPDYHAPVAADLLQVLRDTESALADTGLLTHSATPGSRPS